MLETPKTLEDCIKLRGTGDCVACGYQPMKLGTVKTCNKRLNLRSH
jgi:hypothetical protein